MFREPFFQILDVTDQRGRSMTDIALDVTRARGVTLADIRGNCLERRLCNIRRDIIDRLKAERRDLSSAQIGRFLNREASTIRHHRRTRAKAAK